MDDNRPFNNNNLTPLASINRVLLIDLPGVPIKDDIRGKTGYQLLGLEAVAGLVRHYLPFLPLTGQDSADLAIWEGAFSSTEKPIRRQAELVAEEAGRRLGYLLATLKRGDEINRQARGEWRPEHWEFWASIKEIRLGGGLVSGRAASHIKTSAIRGLEEAGVISLSVKIAEFPSKLPLIGVARSLNPSREAALVFDFGQSWIKRALAFYRDGELNSLKILKPIPSRIFDDFKQGGSLYRNAIEVPINTLHEAHRAGYNPGEEIGISLARYIKDERPLELWDPVDYDFREEVSREISRELGRPVTLQIIHDGSAAARVYAGNKDTAVLMLGTALGTGFPPLTDELCPISSEFSIGY
jgi:hypothetical protein